MAVRQYIGARYVPLFMGEWNNKVAYEPLSVVQYQGASYTSKQAVPIGIEITNVDYWALTGNYNAQIEQYRQEVQEALRQLGEITTSVDELEKSTAQINDELEKSTAQINDELEKSTAQINENIDFLANRQQLSDTVFVSPFIELVGMNTQSCCAADVAGVRNIWLSKFNAENDIEIIHYAGKAKTSKSVGNLGHCNAMAYYNGKVYCATQGGSAPSGLGIAVFDAQTLTFEKSIPIDAWAIDTFNDKFYTLNAGDNLVHVYSPEFVQQETIAVNHPEIGVGQNIFVTERGIQILDNTNQESMSVWGSVISCYNFDGSPDKTITFAGFGEVEQVTKYNNTFLAAQNMNGVVIVGEVSLVSFPTSGLTPSAFVNRYSNSEVHYPVKLYIDPSFDNDFSNGTEQSPYKSCISLSNIIPLIKDAEIIVQSNCTDDISFYGSFLNLKITGKEENTKLPRINVNGSIYYNNGVYDKDPFGLTDASIKFYKCRIQPKNGTLFDAVSNMPAWFIDCVFDFTNGEWMVCKNAARPIYVDNLKLTGNSTQLNMTDMGSIGPVFILDPESAIIFNAVVSTTNQNAASTGLENKVFASGWRRNGWVTEGGDSIVNMPHTSPNQIDQIKFTINTGTMSIRHVSGIQTIEIDSSGNVTYPNIELGEWKTVTTA